jgi:CRISPR-associated protein Csm1
MAFAALVHNLGKLTQCRALAFDELEEWVAAADRLASGLEREEDDREPEDDGNAREEYKALWSKFQAGLEKVAAVHIRSWPLWLDHFDSLLRLNFTQSGPSAAAFKVKPEVSLYDRGKAAAALAVALWRWAPAKGATGEEADDYDEQKFLLIQGDFFGFQDFIFAEGGRTNRQAAEILRGRSFQAALLTELAALRLLELLELPPTSQTLNADGKFLIVAPNIPETIKCLELARKEFNAWFLDHTLGLAGLDLAWLSASANDFCRRPGPSHPFAGLIKKLFDGLEKARYRRFDLVQTEKSAVLPADFQKGVCAWHGRLPADQGSEDEASCALSRDQIMMGRNLARFSRLLVLDEGAAKDLKGYEVSELSMFGYRVAFTNEETNSVSALADSGALRRCWDFSLPEDFWPVPSPGYARRNINAYVPKYSEKEGQAEVGTVKTLDRLAEADWERDENGKRLSGITAWAVLKGGVDDWGLIFQNMLNDQSGGQKPSFAKWAGLSRQVNDFFALYLPALCAKDFPNTYTVFAGGEGFFLIGPLRSVQGLAGKMADEFKSYVPGNLHFSAGMVLKKPGAQLAELAAEAENAMKRAKEAKNSFCLFGVVESWNKWSDLEEMEKTLGDLAARYGLPDRFIYDLAGLLEMSLEEEWKPEAALWRGRLAYKTARHLERRISKENRQAAQRDIMNKLWPEGLEKFKEAFRIPLFNHIYKHRQ